MTLSPNERVCRYCGAPLRGRLALGDRRWCDAPQCARQGSARYATEARADLVEEAKRVCPGVAVVGVVPAEPGALAPLSEERRRKFAHHLRRTLEQAESGKRSALVLRDPHDSTPGGLEPLDAPPGLIATACGTCRGRCCNQGEDHAFLDTESLERYRRRGPDVSSEEIARRYESYLPKRSATGSCLFHAERGCALPRELRSETCNRFVCRGVRELSGQIALAGARNAVIVASEGRAMVRFSVWESKRFAGDDKRGREV